MLSVPAKLSNTFLLLQGLLALRQPLSATRTAAPLSLWAPAHVFPRAARVVPPASPLLPPLYFASRLLCVRRLHATFAAVQIAAASEPFSFFLGLVPLFWTSRPAQ